MKLVREHINEVFLEDSDPIDDLGIGMQNLLINFCKEKGYGIIDLDQSFIRVLEFCVRYSEYKFIDFLISKYNIDLTETEKYYYILGNAAYNSRWEGAKYLIKKGLNLDETIKIAERRALKQTTKNLYVLKKILKEKL